MPSDATTPGSTAQPPIGEPPSAGSRQPSPAGIARDLVHRAWKGTLGSVARVGGHPYASLVAVACEPDGTPLLLLSGLAEHTRNSMADDRASLLLDGTPPGPGALTGPRVTLVGRLAETGSPTARHRYLARHPDAAQFIDFADFRLYALDVAWAHLVAGFGRIQRLERADVILGLDDARELVAAEPDILQHMNEDHADAIALMAQHGDGAHAAAPDSGGNPAAWRMVGCDPEGVDLAAGTKTRRLLFLQRVRTVDEVREALMEQVRAARSKSGAGSEKPSG